MSMSLVRKLSVTTAVALAAVFSLHVRAQEVTLKVGDDAPALTVGKWVKGEPVTKFAPGTVYVIECWATWCGPCRAAIPHVTELQKKYEGKVVVIGQNMWENDEAKVAPFVTAMGAKMDYRVVLDDKPGQDGSMAKNWMMAAGQNGIPCSFIVDKAGKIAWIGHPMAMAPVLEKVVAGTYDLKVEGAAQAEEMAKEQAASRKTQELNGKLKAALDANDFDAAMKVIDEAAAADPRMAESAPSMKFSILIKAKRYDDAYALNDQVFDSVKDQPEGLNRIAWAIATAPGIEKRDLKFAGRLAERAVELTKREDGAVLDTLARIQFDSGEVDKAIATETEAVAKTTDENKKEMQEALEKYKAAKK